MDRKRMVIALGIALILALFVSRLVYQALKQAKANGQQSRTQDIIVASRKLPLGIRLEESDLRWVAWPAATPIPGMCMRLQDCLGRALLSGVVENQPILEENLAPKDAGAGLPAVIPEGMRAVSVAVNDVVAVAGFVLPGTKVDVLVTGSKGGQEGSVTRTILQDIRVLAAGHKIQQDKSGEPQNVPVITLLVTPEQANLLAMASAEGRIQLALRNTTDTLSVETLPVDQASVFTAGRLAGARRGPRSARPRPRATPDPFHSVEVIRGNKREVESFPRD